MKEDVDKEKIEEFGGTQYGLIQLKDIKSERANRIFVIVMLAVLVLSVIISLVTAIVSIKKTQKEIENLSEVEKIEEMLEPTPIVPVYSAENNAKVTNIYASNDGEKVAYLTFDDGPSKNITPQILDILRNEGIKATFFVLGSRVELYPELVRQEYNEGHYVANHGYSHNYSSIYSSPNAVLDEYNLTESKIKEALGIDSYSSHLFRFPGGSEGGKYKNVKNEAKAILEANNISYVNWNSLNNDSVGKPTHESLLRDLKTTSRGKKKIVILMHDAGTKQLTADTLGEAISYLKGEGYSFKNFYDIMK